MRNTKFTIVGANGYVGSQLCFQLEKHGVQVSEIDRFDSGRHAKEDLGHVICAAGVTTDFLARPIDTMNAHVSTIADILQTARFESFLYLSSTRVYQGGVSTQEDQPLVLSPTDHSQLYNASKIAGESLCLAINNPNVRIIRLSNIYGVNDPSSNFLIDSVRSAVDDGHVALRSSLQSEKDFVSISDVVAILPRIALGGSSRLYNVASGCNTRYADILKALQYETGCTLYVEPESRVVSFPEISVDRLTNEFSFTPSMLMDDIPNLIQEYLRMQP